MLRSIVCGFGGVGPQGPASAPNAWVVALVQLTSSAAAISDVHAATITLLDASGGVLARATGPIDVRAAPSSHPTDDFSTFGTAPFDGHVAGGATVMLRLHAPLDTRLDALYRARPSRAQIDLVDENGPTSVECSPLTTWPAG